MDDYMDKQTAADLLDNLIGMVEDTQENDYDTAIRMGIEALKAEVQPVRHGHWIPKFGGEFKGGAYWYDCSKCGHTVAGGIPSGNHFCKNCGARMDDEEDG